MLAAQQNSYLPFFFLFVHLVQKRVIVLFRLGIIKWLRIPRRR